ncbi:MAG: hypothetical protein WCJ32_07360 [Actinomycetota bacterium]
MAKKGYTPASVSKPADSGDIADVFELVKAYAKQETLGPLKGIGRKIGFGLAGATSLALSLFFISLGLLRLLQTKVHSIAHGAWSFVPYLIVFVVCVAITGFALSRITKIEKEYN